MTNLRRRALSMILIKTKSKSKIYISWATAVSISSPRLLVSSTNYLSKMTLRIPANKQTNFPGPFRRIDHGLISAAKTKIGRRRPRALQMVKNKQLIWMLWSKCRSTMRIMRRRQLLPNAKKRTKKTVKWLTQQKRTQSTTQMAAWRAMSSTVVSSENSIHRMKS